MREIGSEGWGVVDWKRKIAELWQRESTSVVHGWLEGGTTYGPEDEGKRYLEISCHDLGLRYDRQRFADRRPVFQSQVKWPGPESEIAVSRTIGPSDFSALSDGTFSRLKNSQVALTGDLPMNHGSTTVVVGLLAAPGGSLLDTMTGFLGDLEELTKVPQLTTAAPVADKIAQGVDKLLGNDKTRALLGFQTSVQADELRDGYYVMTDWPTTLGHLKYLRTSNDTGLEVLHDDGAWRSATGFNYFVLRFRTTGSKPNRWQDLKDVKTLVTEATANLETAISDEDGAAASRAIGVALVKALNDPNLAVIDREAASKLIQARWSEAVERRRKREELLAKRPKAAPVEPGSSPTPDLPEVTDSGPILEEANKVARDMNMLTRRTFRHQSD